MSKSQYTQQLKKLVKAIRHEMCPPETDRNKDNKEWKLNAVANVDKMIVRRNGQIVFKRFFFYKHGYDAGEFRRNIVVTLNKILEAYDFEGVTVHGIGHGESWNAWPKDSWWHATFTFLFQKQDFNVGLVIAAGYDQKDSNEEGLTDFGDAVRIACEQDNMIAPTPKQRKEAEKAFHDEFRVR